MTFQEKNISRFLLLFLMVLAHCISYSQTILINPAGDGGFETGNTFAANGWSTAQNGNNSNNHWTVDNAASAVFAGLRSAYVTNNNSNPDPYSYTTNNSRTQHFYRDVTFPVGEPNITLTFKWKCNGEGAASDQDNLKVFLISTGTTPSGGSALSSGSQIGATWYNLQNSWQTASITIDPSNEGTTKRLVFSWKNNNSGGSQPPAAIDSISLVSVGVLGPPQCAPLTSPADGTTLSCGTFSTDLTWTPPVSGTPPTAYKIYFGTNNPPTNILTGTNLGNTLTFNTGILTVNTTYYWQIIPTNSYGDGSGCAIRSFTTPNTPLNDNPCNAIPLPVNATCTYTTYTNSCATATSGVTTPTCGSYSGGDVWFKITVPAGGAFNIKSLSGIVTDGAMELYSGPCDTLVQLFCDDDGGPGFMPEIFYTGLTPGSIVFLRFWEFGNNNNGTFQLCVEETCSGGSPSNDNPCNATPLPLGVYLQGNNSCSGIVNEPVANPSCWTAGVRNTVWYSIVAPASQQLRIRCNPGTLADPQIALYSGTCGPSLTQIACSNNGPACNGTTLSSDISVSGLTANTTYYLAVDGTDALTGVFNILAIDGNQSLPPIPGQDCGIFQPVCNQSFTIANPGYTGYGNICDFDGSGANCLNSGERASAWYEFTIASNGNLTFNIVPNDWPGAPSTASTDYDFAVWKTLGSGAVSCANIATGSVPLRCNYSALGVTGLNSSATNNAPAAYPGFNSAYEQQLAVVAGEKYVLVVSNWTANSSGFSINFNASPISYSTAAGGTVYWSGKLNTDWFNTENWGGCALPSCTTDAVIPAAVINQPLINASGSACKSITINPGASLSINNGFTLNVCENFNCNGSLNAASGSIVLFNNGSVNQAINGNVTGTNALGNLTISKTGGMVTLAQNLDVKSNLTISNATSTLNALSNTIKVGGNFSNNGTFNSVSPGLLEFNGSGVQSYLNVNAVANVRMNNPSGAVTLQSPLILNNTSTLTLDAGKIITTPVYQVEILNRNIASVTNGNSSSYIEGKLKRSINPTGSYNFPVGHSTKGYQRANINYLYAGSPTITDFLVVDFVTHPSLPGPLGITDCGVTFSQNGLDNGYWSFTASNNPNSGMFDLTLYNANYTNAANGWTIMKNDGSGWSAANGTCVASPVTAVLRTGMSGIANFSTAQSPNFPLPVDWLYFNAKALQHSIELKWATVSEEDNLGFEVYKMDDQTEFEKTGWVKGNGTSNTMNNYRFEDKNVIPGINYYYKLKQIDINGKSSESKTVSAKLKGSTIKVFPNPLKGEGIISFNLELSSNISIDVLSSTGSFVKNIVTDKFERGAQTIILNTKTLRLANGFYTIRLIAQESVQYTPLYIIE